MRRIDDLRWLMSHFDGDALEKESVRLTGEIFKTLAVLLFGALVLGVML